MINAGHIRFNWYRYIILAEELLSSIPEDTEDESKERTSISRAYYGAFHRASDFVKSINQTIDIYRAGSHENVIRFFKDIGKSDRDYKQVAEDLRHLKDRRQKADYRDNYFGTVKFGNLRLECATSIEIAKGVIEQISKIEAKEKV